jgi:hypothetical protein
MRKITANKSLQLFGHEGPIKYPLEQNGLPVSLAGIVFHKIDFVEEVRTDDGIMSLVRITSVADLNNPDNDIAVLVPFFMNVRWGGELWYWREKFWLKGVDKLGVDYYQKKCYALYEVEIENHNELLAAMA